MDNLDKFYTPIQVAKICIDLIPELNSYDMIIEPSAGNGSFSKQINNCIAYDISPEDNNIIQKNFFEVEKQNAKHLLVIGNPPFGKRSSLAKDFIKHSRKIGAETIAFILPDTFSKLSNQSKTLFPENWRLIVEYKIKDNNFILPDGQKYHVPCSFYVWTCRKGDTNLRQKKLPPHPDFQFLTRGDINADFSINGNSGKVKEINEITNPKAEHYIKAVQKDKETLKQIFQSLDFNFLSSVNGGNAWIGQQDILKAYWNYIS